LWLDIECEMWIVMAFLSMTCMSSTNACVFRYCLFCWILFP
jgi:hypothetical protein